MYLTVEEAIAKIKELAIYLNNVSYDDEDGIREIDFDLSAINVTNVSENTLDLIWENTYNFVGDNGTSLDACRRHGIFYANVLLQFLANY